MITVSIQMVDASEQCAELMYTKRNGEVICISSGECESDADCVKAAKEDLRDIIKCYAFIPTQAIYRVRVDGVVVKQKSFDLRVAA